MYWSKEEGVVGKRVTGSTTKVYFEIFPIGQDYWVKYARMDGEVQHQRPRS